MQSFSKVPNEFNAGSISALYCEMRCSADMDTLPVAHGTAFVGFCKTVNGLKAVLLTARHNLTGKDHFDQSRSLCKVKPTVLRVYFPKKENCLDWFYHDFELYDDMDLLETELWLEHPSRKVDVDVAGIQLDIELVKNIHEGALTRLSPNSEVEYSNSNFCPSARVCIVGFPLERKENYLAIWSTGALAYASEFDFPFVKPDKTVVYLPAYLVNSKTFSGQSGSIVVANPGHFGWWESGEFMLAAGASDEIMGMYTCRLHAKAGDENSVADLGLVWKQHILYEILNSSQELQIKNTTLRQAQSERLLLKSIC